MSAAEREREKAAEVSRVARAIGDALDCDYDRLPELSTGNYPFDRRSLRRLARAAIKAIRKTFDE